jgi:hypothetical protein
MRLCGSGIARCAANAGAKVTSFVSSMALGADCIEDCELLRVARTGEVLGHRVVAPSTLGTFLRSFSFGHVRQLDRVLGQTLRRASAAGTGPREGRLVVEGLSDEVCVVVVTDSALVAGKDADDHQGHL